jgi:hypothetical protein
MPAGAVEYEISKPRTTFAHLCDAIIRNLATNPAVGLENVLSVTNAKELCRFFSIDDNDSNAIVDRIHLAACMLHLSKVRPASLLLYSRCG